MSALNSDYVLREGFEKMDFEKVHSMLAGAYWCPGISRALVEKAARNSSLVIGCFLEGRQVAYCRIVSDRATFGWVSDVIVDPEHQGKGLARRMVRYALAHSEHQGFRRWVLKTSDAQGVYSAVGFRLVPDPEKWMDHVPADRQAAGDD
ncbi:MAG: GNAT family N-acetyltransferase [Armatimonadetes bacterium]|nr:GNAT family N-acetyltransferase [Armatimonadota bacterium]